MNDTATTKPRRVTIDLTPAAAGEVDRLRRITGLTTADIFRHAFTLFRIYVDSKRDGFELELVDASSKSNRQSKRIELPLEIGRTLE